MNQIFRTAWFGMLLMLCMGQQSFAQGVLPIHRYYNQNSTALTWDNTASNSVINNGSGTWNATNTVWVKQAPAGANVAWVPGSNATFGGNPGVGAAGTVTVSGTRSVANMVFNPAASGTFTLTGGTLSLTGGLLTTNQNATINSTLTGSASYLKRGDSTLTLGGNNTALSSNITVSRGELDITANSSAGTGTIIMGDANTGSNNIGWFWAGSLTPANNISITNNGTGITTIGTTSAGLNTDYSGNITLNKDLTIFDGTVDRTSFNGIVSGTGNITIDGTGSWNSATGTGARASFDNNSNSFIGQITILANKAFQLNGTDVVNNQSIVNNGSLVLNAGANNTTTIGTLKGANTGICEIHSQVTGPQTLSIGNDNNSGTYNGIIRNNGALGTLVMNLTKEGTGIDTLTGANTYTGPTTVNRGVLAFTNTVPSSGTFALAVSNTSPTTANSGRLTLPTSPAISGKIFNIIITETGTGISFLAANWTGTATGTPVLRVNGTTRTFGTTTPGGTTVTYNTASGITVTR